MKALGSSAESSQAKTLIMITRNSWIGLEEKSELGLEFPLANRQMGNYRPVTLSKTSRLWRGWKPFIEVSTWGFSLSSQKRIL
jgi:hypothetical protein